MSNNVIRVSDFFKNEYSDYASYDLVRKIASYIDGQKNASRKVLHTVIQQNINSYLKVSNLGPKVQDYTEYLHGSLEGIVVNMTKDYIGSGNNIPLLDGDGNFGTAFIPEAAATRYIFTRKAKITDSLFNKQDYENLPEQNFEGTKIEPKYYMPVLPLLAINGSEGVSVGFAQKILPRDPIQIKKWVQCAANGEKPDVDLRPYWNGSTCPVEQGETSKQWIIKGQVKQVSPTKLIIDKVPVGVTLKGYQKVLDKLEDDKVIKGYTDKSDDDTFLFEVRADKSFCEKDNEWLLKKLKLIKTVSENYTCIDENNTIIQFDSFEDILWGWYGKRIAFNEIRKRSVIRAFKKRLIDSTVKKEFINGVVNGSVKLSNRSDDQIKDDMMNGLPNKIGELASTEYYTYLINLPMKSLTEKEINKLNDYIKEQKVELEEYQKLSYEHILLNDLEQVKL